MKREDLVRKVANELDTTLVQADIIVLEFVEAIKEGLATDGRVCINEFASFTLKDSAPRQVSPPGMRGYVLIPAKKKIRFRMSEHLFMVVNRESI